MATNESEAVQQLTSMLEKLQTLRETAQKAMEANLEKVERLEAENKHLSEKVASLQEELARLEQKQ